MQRTVSIPVDLPKERFLPLLKMCAEIFNQHVDWALCNQTYNKSRAHHDLYALLRCRYPEVPSALVQTVRDTAMEAVKATKFKRCPRQKPTSALRDDHRTITLRGQQLTLSCLGKRSRVILPVPEYFREVFETWTFKGATLTYTRRNKQFWVRLVFETTAARRGKLPPADFLSNPQIQEGDVLGVDRGLYHLASTSQGQFFSGSRTRGRQRHYLHNRSTLQAKGTRAAKRRLRAMSGREQRFSKDVNHCVSKKLARSEGMTIFALEDLSGIRNQRRGKKMNKWLSSWPFSQLEQFLSYKSEALGKRIALVDARYTSQRCSRCGHRSSAKRKKSRFCCGSCGYTCHSDINSAINIRDNYLLSTASGSVEQVSVNAPYVTSNVA